VTNRCCFVSAQKWWPSSRVLHLPTRCVVRNLYTKRAGFELHLEDRNVVNKEKKIDTGIATLLTKDASKHGNPKDDVFTLVAGDADYVPTINEVKKDGYRVEVGFWNHASKELWEAATKFIGLDQYLETLRL
jgi:uncharacterized LabA/DUF88 family protein